MQGVQARSGKYRVRWIDAAGHRQSETVGSIEDAELVLLRHRTEAAETKRGLRRLAPTEKTFGELCDYWLEVRLPFLRGAKQRRHIVEHHLRPALGAMKLRELTAEHFDRLRARVGHLKPATQRSILSHVSALLGVAAENRWLEHAPRVRMPTVRVDEQPFRYLRNDDEINKFLAAAWSTNPLLHAMYSAAIYTGMRKGELAALTWSDIDFDRCSITVRRSFDGPTKSGRTRYVPLFDALRPMLAAWKLQNGSARFVFASPDGDMLTPDAWAFNTGFKKTLLRAGFEKDYLHFHGMRHTFASNWVRRGHDLFRLKAILGHSKFEMTERYSHLAPADFARDLDAFGSAQHDADVVQLGQRRELQQRTASNA